MKWITESKLNTNSKKHGLKRLVRIQTLRKESFRMTELDNAVKEQQEAIIKVKKQLELMQKKIDELEKKIDKNEV